MTRALCACSRLACVREAMPPTKRDRYVHIRAVPAPLVCVAARSRVHTRGLWSSATLFLPPGMVRWNGVAPACSLLGQGGFTLATRWRVSLDACAC